MNLKFIVRADASSMVGSGHIMRCLPLIEVLSDLKYEVEVWGDISDFPWAEQAISNSGARLQNSSVNGDFVNSRNQVLILDSYTLPPDTDFLSTEKWRKVIVIGDPNTPNYPCDLFVNSTISKFSQNPRSRARYFLSGPEFIMARSEIIKAKRIRNSHKLAAQKILVSGGAGDFGDFTHSIVKNIMKTEFDFSAIVFSRNAPEYSYDSRFTFKNIGSGLAKEIEDTSIFLSTAGTSAFDFLTLGGILGLGCAVENQTDNYLQLQENGLAIGVGKCDNNGVWEVNSKNLNSLLADESLQDMLTLRSMSLFKGDAAQRITREIITLLS